jgi:hypothetical protein
VDFKNRVRDFLNSSASSDLNENDDQNRDDEYRASHQRPVENDDTYTDRVSRLSSAHTSYQDLPCAFSKETAKSEKLNVTTATNEASSSPTTATASAANTAMGRSSTALLIRHNHDSSNNNNNNNNNNTANTSMTNVSKFEPTDTNNSNNKNTNANNSATVAAAAAAAATMTSSSTGQFDDSKSKNSYTNSKLLDDYTLSTVRFDEKNEPGATVESSLIGSGGGNKSSYEFKSSFCVLKTPCCNDVVKATVSGVSLLPSSFDENFLLRKSGCSAACQSCSKSNTNFNNDIGGGGGSFYSSTMSMPTAAAAAATAAAKQRATYFSCSYEPKLPTSLEDPFIRLVCFFLYTSS